MMFYVLSFVTLASVVSAKQTHPQPTFDEKAFRDCLEFTNNMTNNPGCLYDTKNSSVSYFKAPEIYFGGCNLTNLTCFSNTSFDLSSFTSLRIRNVMSAGGSISSLAPLSRLTWLTNLELDDTGIIDLMPLVGLTKLTSLSLSINQGIVDLTPLENMTNLQRIWVQNDNAIQSYMPLRNAVGMYSIEAGNSNMSDLSFMQNMSKLESLHLDSNGITDISLLSTFTVLSDVSLFGNGVTNLSSLTGLQKLNFLNVQENPVCGSYTFTSNISVVVPSNCTNTSSSVTCPACSKPPRVPNCTQEDLPEGTDWFTRVYYSVYCFLGHCWEKHIQPLMEETVEPVAPFPSPVSPMANSSH